MAETDEGANHDAVLYIDESGSTGSNYLDPRQPVFALAGWVVRKDIVLRVWEAVERVRREHFHQAAELKATAALKRDSSKRIVADLFAALAGIGALPIVVFAEKRYCLAAKIVDLCIDPHYNAGVGNRFSGSAEVKQEFANGVAEAIDEATLARFSSALQSADAEALHQAIEAVAQAVRPTLGPEFSGLLMGCRAELEELAKAESWASPLGPAASTLNIPCLVSLLSMAEQLCRELGIGRLRVVHDAHAQYEDGLRAVFNIGKGMGRDWPPPIGADVGVNALKSIVEFQLMDSKESMGLQAADLLAGVVREVIRKALAGEGVSPVDIDLARFFIPGLFVDRPRVVLGLWSESSMRDVGRAFIYPMTGGLPPAPRADVGDRIFPPRSLAGDLGVKGANVKSFPMPDVTYAIAAKASGELMAVLPSPGGAADGLQCVCPLFSTEAAANAFLDLYECSELSEAQQVVSFGPTDIEQFVAALEEKGCQVDAVVYDGLGGEPVHLRISELVAGLRAVMSRLRKIIDSGTGALIVDSHTIDGNPAISVLLSSGKYGAMLWPDGEIEISETREGAVAALRKKGGI